MTTDRTTSATTALRPRGTAQKENEMPRDDLLTLIHKALRYGLLRVTLQAGATDWNDPADVSALRERWDTVHGLVAAHAGHEDRHIFALLESKQPGSVAELDIGHDEVEAELDGVAAKFTKAFETRDPAAGLDAYRALTHFVGTATLHFANEEPVVMERIWATCTDDEIAACRAAFMAEITPDEAVATWELLIPATTHDERAAVMGAARAAAPPHVFAVMTGVAERTLDSGNLAKLQARVGVPEPVAS